MITLSWWVFVPMFVLAVFCAVALVLFAWLSWRDRGGHDQTRRSVYLAWCHRNHWCPEHDLPDKPGHTLILDAAPWLTPCPGSATRHAMSTPPRRSGHIDQS
jgi:hypothetical protein